MNTLRHNDVQALAKELRRDLLSSIHTLYGRLVFLGGLRDPNSGQYEHFETSCNFGEEVCHVVLEAEHVHAYRDWLAMNLEQQRADLMLYLVTVGLNRRQVLQTWLVTSPFRSLIPLHTQPVEQEVFLSDMSALLAVLMNEYGIAGPEGAA
ncbi:MAG: hypothetical protein KIT83_14825 [Bryobacterales bacterium]|nr:hypothetical protein [Bryobacterales bacterium]